MLFQTNYYCIIILICSFPVIADSILQAQFKDDKNYSSYEIDLIDCIYDFVHDFPENKLVIAYLSSVLELNLSSVLLRKLQLGKISVVFYNFSSINNQEKYFEYLSEKIEHFLPVTTIFYGTRKLYEHILLEIYARNYIRRNLIYIFVWGNVPVNEEFEKSIHYAMHIFLITNPRPKTFRIYYNQATSYKEHNLGMVNWWNSGIGLFYHPTLPKKKSVYKDFHEKILQVPVLHKPPWHFVNYSNSGEDFKVIGGRDDRILNLLSRKLNFKYNYSDPSERIQGAILDNGTVNGVLGLIYDRKADLFIGDMGITHERFKIVEFSFITLADSGAFVTHVPSKLNEALALLRPFHWQVWQLITITFIIAGIFLYILIALPNVWQPRFLVDSHVGLFFDCIWFSISILLKQTGKEPSATHKARFFIILLSISATYVITDMYSANLTSLLARPGREKGISNLYQLKNVMQTKRLKLFVEEHSPSFALLENGTGIYGEIWKLYKNRPEQEHIFESVEEGVQLVKDKRNVAVMAGRETLFFNIQRFGSKNFHLSEKLNTAYSAIALQLGCPFVEEISHILISIFEAGILTKMTENEYENLGKQKQILESSIDDINNGNTPDGTNINEIKQSKINEDDKLEPISLKMIQGAFYLLFIGNMFAGMIWLMEIAIHRYYTSKSKKRKMKKFLFLLVKTKRKIKCWQKNLKNKITQIYRSFMHDAYTLTLEYTE